MEKNLECINVELSADKKKQVATFQETIIVPDNKAADVVGFMKIINNNEVSITISDKTKFDTYKKGVVYAINFFVKPEKVVLTKEEKK